MTDERFSGIEFSAVEASAPGSPNGSHEEAEPTSAAAVAEAPSEEKPVAGSEAPEVEAPEPQASSAEAAVPEMPAGNPDLVSQFSRAMHEAAAAERTRLGEDIGRRREAHLAGVQARREREATQMRELADEDRASIESWVASEQDRITAERDRRVSVLEEDLTTSLAEHASTYEREVEAVEAAITTHRGEVEHFFESLDDETDPVRIAQQASSRPAFPDLDAVTPAATDGATSATTEPVAASEVPVGVMDAEPAARPAGGWIAPGDLGDLGSTDVAAAALVGAPIRSVPVAVMASPPVVSSEGLLQSTPASRPMSWLRRDRDQSDR